MVHIQYWQTSDLSNAQARQVGEHHGKPVAFRVEANGEEFVRQAMRWTTDKDIPLGTVDFVVALVTPSPLSGE